MIDPYYVRFTVNGDVVEDTIEPRMSLADFLRGRLQLTGTQVGCEHGVCGACTVFLDGVTVRSCLVFALQCHGSNVETIEGATKVRKLEDLQKNFIKHNALQCGFCTSGMLLSAEELLDGNPNPTRQEIREHIAGNYCRCTGYHAIVDAIDATAKRRNERFGN